MKNFVFGLLLGLLIATASAVTASSFVFNYEDGIVFIKTDDFVEAPVMFTAETVDGKTHNYVLEQSDEEVSSDPIYGQTVVVRNSPEEPVDLRLNCRDDHSTQANKVVKLITDTTATYLAVYKSDTWTWWQIELEDGTICWSAAFDYKTDEVWLEPQQ